jgi:hypothetical protein
MSAPSTIARLLQNCPGQRAARHVFIGAPLRAAPFLRTRFFAGSSEPLPFAYVDKAVGEIYLKEIANCGVECALSPSKRKPE